jgi:hypothetical protein
MMFVPLLLPTPQDLKLFPSLEVSACELLREGLDSQHLLDHNQVISVTTGIITHSNAAPAHPPIRDISSVDSATVEHSMLLYVIDNLHHFSALLLFGLYTRSSRLGHCLEKTRKEGTC